MNPDNPERAFKEAEAWLVSAKYSLAESDDETISHVSCAQSIHAIIRANDALSMKLLGVKATRHDDAPALFAKLVRDKPAAATD